MSISCSLAVAQKLYENVFNKPLPETLPFQTALEASLRKAGSKYVMKMIPVYEAEVEEELKQLYATLEKG